MTIICDDERARGAARNVRDALAVLRPFMYAMRWRTNVSYALAVRIYLLFRIAEVVVPKKRA